ncbi:hypothetical protein [Paraburkholderia sediminicola]|uniref:hypothetical protein n=1 Tax=Paraburkholderia sediminicola TaxID=458836 RepID=UPI0038B96F5A
MFESSIEKTVIGAAILLWFAHGWYLNTRLERVHAKLDAVLENFDGLRKYLYEIDPQFDDEREVASIFEASLDKPDVSFAGLDALQLEQRKRERGQRTLDTPFTESL